MVRFSDLLGGQETPEEKPVVDTPLVIDDAVAEETVPEETLPEDMPEPEDVLERLTQYATSARAADQVPAPEAAVEPPSPEPGPAPVREAESEADAVASLAPVADDLLPRGKGKRRS